MHSELLQPSQVPQNPGFISSPFISSKFISAARSLAHSLAHSPAHSPAHQPHINRTSTANHPHKTRPAGLGLKSHWVSADAKLIVTPQPLRLRFVPELFSTPTGICNHGLLLSKVTQKTLRFKFHRTWSAHGRHITKHVNCGKQKHCMEVRACLSVGSRQESHRDRARIRCRDRAVICLTNFQRLRYHLHSKMHATLLKLKRT